MSQAAGAETLEALLRTYCRDADPALSELELQNLTRYGRLLQKWNRKTNLVADSSARSIVFNHIGDCLAAVASITGQHIVDVGSGAGLPGLVLAMLKPGSRVTLLESRQRKARFLRQVAIELKLSNVQVAAARVEHWQPQASVDTIVCRGYSSLAKFCADTRGIQRTGTLLYAMKAIVSEDELSAIPAGFDLEAVMPLKVSGWAHRHLVVIRALER